MLPTKNHKVCFLSEYRTFALLPDRLKIYNTDEVVEIVRAGDFLIIERPNTVNIVIMHPFYRTIDIVYLDLI